MAKFPVITAICNTITLSADTIAATVDIAHQHIQSAVEETQVELKYSREANLRKLLMDIHSRNLKTHQEVREYHTALSADDKNTFNEMYKEVLGKDFK